MKIHGLVLICCGIIGFTGHFLQFGVARITPWMPSAVGLFIILINYYLRNEPGFKKYLPLILAIVFGTVTTIMCFKFLPQASQPLRKKIIFIVMSGSAWVIATGHIVLLLGKFLHLRRPINKK